MILGQESFIVVDGYSWSLLQLAVLFVERVECIVEMLSSLLW